MSIAETLEHWKQFANTAARLTTLKKEVSDLEAEYENAQSQFKKRLQELPDSERESILSIMAVYQAEGTSAAPEARENADRNGNGNTPLRWMLNKDGNEGTGGAKWDQILSAWQTQYPSASTDVLYSTLNSNEKLFSMTGEKAAAVLQLTPEGQSQFLSGD